VLAVALSTGSRHGKGGDGAVLHPGRSNGSAVIGQDTALKDQSVCTAIAKSVIL